MHSVAKKRTISKITKKEKFCIFIADDVLAYESKNQNFYSNLASDALLPNIFWQRVMVLTMNSQAG